MRTLRTIGIVSLILGTICMVLSSSGLGYSWEPNLNWGHNDPVPPNELDAVQTYYMYNCQPNNVMCVPLTGGPIFNPELVQDMGMWLIFHTSVQLYIYWGPGNPAPPPNCIQCYVSAGMILYREIGQNYIPIGGDSDSIALNQPGMEFHDIHLHFGEQRDYQPGDRYLLKTWVSGYWIDNTMQMHSTGQILQERYYMII